MNCPFKAAPPQSRDSVALRLREELQCLCCSDASRLPHSPCPADMFQLGSVSMPTHTTPTCTHAPHVHRRHENTHTTRTHTHTPRVHTPYTHALHVRVGVRVLPLEVITDLTASQKRCHIQVYNSARVIYITYQLNMYETTDRTGVTGSLTSEKTNERSKRNTKLLRHCKTDV